MTRVVKGSKSKAFRPFVVKTKLRTKVIGYNIFNMSFWRYIFSFLYTRNWHNGQMELSRPRLALFSAVMFLIVLALLLISVLQAPIEYRAK